MISVWNLYYYISMYDLFRYYSRSRHTSYFNIVTSVKKKMNRDNEIKNWGCSKVTNVEVQLRKGDHIISYETIYKNIYNYFNIFYTGILCTLKYLSKCD